MNVLVQLAVNRDRTTDAARRRPRQKSIIPATSISAAPSRKRMITLWTHHEPDRLHAMPMDKTDPHTQVAEFLDMHYRTPPKSYSLALLVSGTEYPIPVMKHNVDLDYGILLCLPLLNMQVNIQLPSGGVFKESINPMNSVLDLKECIQKSMGFPEELQDISHNGHVLANNSLIMDQKIKPATKLQLFLQPSKSFSVQVKPFWGGNYILEATSCMLVGQLLQLVLQKAFSNSLSELKERMFQYKSMYSHLLMVEHNMSILDKSTCLNQYNVKGGSVLQVISTSEVRKDNMKNMVIKSHTGETWNMKAAVYDTWFIVALRIHAKCSVALDRMVLTMNGNVINMQCTIGALRHDHTIEVKMEVLGDAACIPQADILFLNLKLPSGITEHLKCSQKDQVKDVKTRLQLGGFKDILYHDMYLKKVKMPQQSRLNEYKLQNNAQLELKLGDFPIYVSQGPNAFAIQANVKWTVQELISKIQERTTLLTDKCQLIFKGEAINRVRPDLVSLDRIGVTVHSKVFIETTHDSHVMQLVTDTDIINIKTNFDSVDAQQFEKCCQSPATLMINLKWFFKWRYPQSGKTLGILDHRNKRAQKAFNKPVLSLTNGDSPSKSSEGASMASSTSVQPSESASTPPEELLSRLSISNSNESSRQDMVSSNNSSVDGSSTSLLPSIGKSSLKAADSTSSHRKHMTVRFELPPEKPKSRSKGLITNALTTDYFITDSPKYGPLTSRSDRHCSSAVDLTRIKLGSVMPNYAQYNDKGTVIRQSKRKRPHAASYIKYHQNMLNYPLPFSGKNFAIRGQCSVVKYQRTKKPAEELDALHRSKSDIGSYARAMQSSTK